MDMYLTLSSNVRIDVQAMRDVTLILGSNCYLKLKNCLYVPKSRKNLISISNLNKYDYSVYFNKRFLLKKYNSFISSSPLVDHLYLITPISLLSCVE